MTSEAKKLSIDDVAEMLDVDPRTVKAWIENKELRAVNLSASRNSKRPRLAIFPADLETFLKSREVQASPEPAPKRRRPKVAKRYW